MVEPTAVTRKGASSSLASPAKWTPGVMAITADSDSANPGSIPGGSSTRRKNAV